MIPIYLDPMRMRIALVGRGAQALRRLNWLHEGGADPDLWSDTPGFDLEQAAGAKLIHGLPRLADLARYHVIWLADLARDEAEILAAAAGSVDVPVNVEDAIELCTFHTPAIVRRGKLVLAAGTGGASPAAARAARERLEAAFPAEWGGALDAIAAARATLRKEGASGEALIADARRRLAEHGLS